MGIQVEYNPDLALRNYTWCHAGTRDEDKCIPLELKVGSNYQFNKKGQRLYWLQGEIPLVETSGGQMLSRPLASIIIKEATHYMLDSEVWIKGVYRVVEVFDPKDTTIHFEAWQRTN